MGMKEYILWGGGLLVLLVVTHGLWQAWRARRRRTAASASAGDSEVTDLADAQQMDIFEPPVLLDDLDAAGIEVGTDVGDETFGDPGVENAPDVERANRGRRVVIAGKRTEPTVPRHDHLFKVRKAPAQEPDRTSQAPAGLDHVVVIWVVAKADERFGGNDLVKALADNGLKYGNDALFRKFDVDSGEELFSVVNGLEPGTFDLSDLEALSTPRVVMLLSLANTTSGPTAFSAMLDAAQDIAISLGGELKDEHMGSMTAQTIEHYRQRISDFKRKSLRK